MENDRSEEIIERLRVVERRLDDLSLRLDKSNAAQAKPPAPPVQPPPPRASEPARETYYSRLTPPPLPVEPVHGFQYLPPQTQAPRPPKQSADTEYLIGAKILPKVGAGIVLLGLTFLVILAYSRGWITPEMMFGMELLLCGAFVTTGILKRDMKEEYGQILTGIGSCGFYLVFAGGHLYYKLYTGEVLVGLFFVLSLANLIFSSLRSSRAFLTIGLIGGLITAAVLPNLNGDRSVLDAWLHFLILIPAAMIVARNKWREMAAGLWVVATVALAPILINGLPWFDKVGILYASTAIALAAFAWSLGDPPDEGFGAFIPTALWVSALLGLGLHVKPDGVWQYLPFLFVFAAIGELFKSRPAIRKAFLLGAIGVPMTVAPFCFPLPEAALILACLSIAAALAAWKWAPRAASEMAAIEFALAAITYLQVVFVPAQWGEETLLLLLLIAAVVMTGRSLARVWDKAEIFTHAAVGLCLPLFGRLGVLMLGRPPFHQRPEFSVTLVLVVFTYYSLGLFIRTRWRSALAAFWTLFALSIVGYAVTLEWLGVPSDLGLLIPLMALPILALAPTPRDLRPVSDAWVAVIVGAMFTRLSVVLGAGVWHWPAMQACIAGAVIYALASFTILRRVRHEAFAYGGWALLFLATVVYVLAAPIPLAVDLWLITGLTAALVLGSRATAPLLKSRQDYSVAISIAGWFAFSRWVWVLLALFAPAVGLMPSITIAWIAYALCLFVLGFAYRVIEFRYVSFVVIAATVGKVMLIDLATTDSLVRVGVLLALGLVMLGGGYWYLRPKRA